MGHSDIGTAGRNRSCSEVLMVAMAMKESEWCSVSLSIPNLQHLQLKLTISNCSLSPSLIMAVVEADRTAALLTEYR